MNFNKICKPFLIYIIFSIVISIYYYNSQAYKNMKKFTLNTIKKQSQNKMDKLVDKLVDKKLNVDTQKLSINQIKNPNYIYIYLSSNLFMFVVLYVLCEFKYMKSAWILLIISIVFQTLITYLMSYFYVKHYKLMLKEINKNNK